MSEQKFVLKNEFAHVCVKLDRQANGIRLMVEDIKTGKKAYFDPLELESLAWCSHGDLASILDPSKTRWIDE